MKRPARTALKHDFVAVRQALNEAWPIVRLLRQGADEIALAQHLREVELMYFNRETSVEALRSIDRALVALDFREN